MIRTPLFGLIADEIRENGPIGLDRYMALCLSHPVHGYYRARDPLGAAGDFTTAPEISQMFGELIGVWVAATWAAMGAPAPCRLVELGPGRGTLMADALRALARTAPGAAFDVHLVETSPLLRAKQQTTLAHASLAPHWHESIATLPDGPAIVVANEFFDALPVRQFERTERGWCERRVGLSEDRLVRGRNAEPDPRIRQSGPTGAVLTVPGAALDIVRDLSGRLVRDNGALLAIDYGHLRPGFGDTLQAVAGHRFVDPFEAPGEADLTTHVDFAALARAAEGRGARCHGPVDQRDFLLALGLRIRAERLKALAHSAQAEAIDAAVARLTDPGRRGMGSLFKACCFSQPALVALPGFPAAS